MDFKKSLIVFKQYRSSFNFVVKPLKDIRPSNKVPRLATLCTHAGSVMLKVKPWLLDFVVTPWLLAQIKVI